MGWTSHLLSNDVVAAVILPQVDRQLIRIVLRHQAEHLL